MTHNQLPILRAQIVAEQRRIERVLDELQSVIENLGDSGPTRIEILAIATLVHNIYNGVENCFSRVAHEFDEYVPKGRLHHRLLIDQLSAPIDGLRPAVLDADLARSADEYRRFRHAFRHMYFFDLKWSGLEPLARGARGFATQIRLAIDELLTSA